MWILNDLSVQRNLIRGKKFRLRCVYKTGIGHRMHSIGIISCNWIGDGRLVEKLGEENFLS